MRSIALVLIASLAAPAVAVADTSNTSSIAQLMVLESGDKNWKSFHGAIWLEIDKASTNYRWGGSQCGGRDLSESKVQLLFAAFRSEYQVTLEYVVNDVKDKHYRCITGFSISKS